MGGFLRTLARVGLVELDDAEEPRPGPSKPVQGAQELDMAAIESILQEDDDLLLEVSTPVEPAPARFEATPQPVEARERPRGAPGASPVEGPLREGRPFQEIYSSAKVAEVAYPAEKMLRVLDGLRAMDPVMRRTAVLAMDAADEAWTVEDSVIDAQRKIRALQAAGNALVEEVRQAEVRAAAELEARDLYRTQATESIRKQITDLEELLRQELEKVAGEKAAIEASVQATAAACARETARLMQEIERLQEILKMFASGETE